MVGTLQKDMSDLGNRLETFEDWPNHVPVKPKDLGEVGFHYVGKNDNDDSVCCFACGGIYSGWRAGDNPEMIHFQQFGERCEFIRDKLALKDIFMAGENEFMPNYDPIGDADMELEDQRLRSFQRNNGWRGLVPPRKLAKAGFYFTGIDDNVKCFTCDLSLTKWEPEDDPVSEHLKYQPDCPFFSGFIERKPQHSLGSFDYMNATNQHETFTGTTSSTVLPYGKTHRLNIAPNNYHGNLSGGISISSEPNSPIKYSNHFPMPHTTSNIPHQQSSLSYKKPETPNYASEHTRLHTFINWPKECPVRPKELIDAGFYYTGEDDKATCFKCNITLAGWVPEDTPWGEHEKWSKDCPLVQEHLARRNPQRSTAINSSAKSMQPQEQTWSAPQHIPQKMPPARSNSPDDELKIVRQPSEQTEESPSHDKGKVYNSISNTSDLAPKTDYDDTDLRKGNSTTGTKDFTSYQKPANKQGKKELFYLQKGVQTLVEQGYNFGTIEEAIQYRTKIQQETINSLEDLLQAVVTFKEKGSEDKEIEPSVNETATDSPTKSPGAFTLGIDPEALRSQVEKMKEAHLCKICLDAEKGVLFLPCGHVVCCPKCASKVQSKAPALCPVCRKKIQSTIRTYLT